MFYLRSSFVKTRVFQKSGATLFLLNLGVQHVVKQKNMANMSFHAKANRFQRDQRMYFIK